MNHDMRRRILILILGIWIFMLILTFHNFYMYVISVPQNSKEIYNKARMETLWNNFLFC